jgi:hypothetical protein
MHARQRILTNGSFKDGIEIDTKWVITVLNTLFDLQSDRVCATHVISVIPLTIFHIILYFNIYLSLKHFSTPIVTHRYILPSYVACEAFFLQNASIEHGTPVLNAAIKYSRTIPNCVSFTTHFCIVNIV